MSLTELIITLPPGGWQGQTKNTLSIHQIHFSLGWFLSLLVVPIVLVYAQVFIFLTSLVLIDM